MNFVINNPEECDNTIENDKQDKINKTMDKTYFRMQKRRYRKPKEKVYKLVPEPPKEIKSVSIYLKGKNKFLYYSR
jgi:hypothetical protein